MQQQMSFTGLLSRDGKSDTILSTSLPRSVRSGVVYSAASRVMMGLQLSERFYTSYEARTQRLYFLLTVYEDPHIRIFYFITVGC